MKFWDWNHIQAEEVTSSQWKKSLDAENLNVAMVELLEGAQTEARSQQTEQVILVLQGALRVQVRDEEVTLRASQMLSIPPHTRYSAVALKTASFVTVRSNAHDSGVEQHAGSDAAAFFDDQSVKYDPDQYLWAV
jgi:quercetin dioxygenase-like cupin family protein